MATIQLPPDFKDFLRLLNSEAVEYLLVGGYAVGYYGYPRATGDIDIWVRASDENAQRLVRVFRAFGFSDGSVSPELFLSPDQVIRMGVPPLRIDVLTTVTGVDFDSCFANREIGSIDAIDVCLIGIDDLRRNKKASGRAKDLDDLEHLA